jgi:hypothetical protein
MRLLREQLLRPEFTNGLPEHIFAIDNVDLRIQLIAKRISILGLLSLRPVKGRHQQGLRLEHRCNQQREFDCARDDQGDDRQEREFSRPNNLAEFTERHAKLFGSRKAGMWASAKSRFCSKVSWQQRASSGITF